MDPLTVPLSSIGNRMLDYQLVNVDGRWKLGGGGGGTEVAPGCPRCSSLNTKFCYYNNYSLSQPRYFCKSCRRYWTKGGSLRNVPVGGGCRKSRRSRAARAARAAGTFPATTSLNGSNNSASSSDDLSERDRASSGATEIDMAKVFARFLNQNTGRDSELDHELNDVCAEQELLSDDVVDPLMTSFLPQDTAGSWKQPPIGDDGIVHEFMAGNVDDDLINAALGLTPSPSELAEGDLERSMLLDSSWIDAESSSSSSAFPSFTWQHETFPSAAADNWKINSTNLMMMGDINWNSSTFDFSGLVDLD